MYVCMYVCMSMRVVLVEKLVEINPFFNFYFLITLAIFCFRIYADHHFHSSFSFRYASNILIFCVSFEKLWHCIAFLKWHHQCQLLTIDKDPKQVLLVVYINMLLQSNIITWVLCRIQMNVHVL